MVKTVAWIGILVASNLAVIVWRLLLHRDAPLWTLGLRIVLLAVLFALAVTIPDLRPLRGYMVALIAGAVGFLLKDLVIQSGPVAAWIKTAPWRDAVIVSSSLKLIPVALMTVTVTGLSRADLFLTVGRLDAPSRLPLLNRALPWTTLGIALIFIVAVPVTLYLSVVLRPNFQMLQRVAAPVPIILIFAAVNAFAEEFVFRSVLLARLVPAVGGEQALWMTSLRWGLGHWFGNPPGPIGAAGATIFGLFLGKSMLETGGFFWAWLIHALQDVVIFTFVIMARVRS